MSSPGFLIHIGYHKTGTTLLQRRVLRSRKMGYSLISDVQELHDAFVGVNGFDFDAETTRSHFSDRALEVGENAKGPITPVLSYERLSGAPHQGGYDSRQIADRLAATFPEARVLIVIREQKSMILSLYKTYVRMGGPATLSEYMAPKRIPQSRTPLFRLDYLMYDKLIGYYRDLFGPKQVLTLPYELFLEDAEAFLATVSDFSGARAVGKVDLPHINVSPSPIPLMLKRHTNRWFLQSVLNPSPVLPFRLDAKESKARTNSLNRILPSFLRFAGEDRWKRLIASCCEDVYEDSNARTCEMVPQDLQRLGYSMKT